MRGDWVEVQKVVTEKIYGGGVGVRDPKSNLVHFNDTYSSFCSVLGLVIVKDGIEGAD